MIERRKFSLLGEFKQLKELRVGKDLLKNLYDCSNLLKYLPQLETLRVEGFQMDNNLAQDITHGGIISNTISNRNHVKNLSLISYQPSTDDELLYIMNTYTDL